MMLNLIAASLTLALGIIYISLGLLSAIKADDECSKCCRSCRDLCIGMFYMTMGAILTALALTLLLNHFFGV